MTPERARQLRLSSPGMIALVASWVTEAFDLSTRVSLVVFLGVYFAAMFVAIWDDDRRERLDTERQIKKRSA